MTLILLFYYLFTNHLLWQPTVWVVCDCSCGHPARFPFPRFLAYFQILLLSLEPALSGSSDSLISWFHAIVQVVRVHVCLGADPRIQRLNCVRTTTFCTSAGLDLFSLSLYCTVDVATSVVGSGWPPFCSLLSSPSQLQSSTFLLVLNIF